MAMRKTSCTLLAVVALLGHARAIRIPGARVRFAAANFRPVRIARSLASADRQTTAIIPCDADVDGCLAFCTDTGQCSIIGNVSALQRLKVTLLFVLWFILSVGYSITNKKVNNMLPGVPCTVATSTVAVGAFFVCALWSTGLRSAPRVSRARLLRTLVPIGICHALGHLAGTVSVAVGSVSFTQIVKAANPVYVCVLSTIVLRTSVSRRVWLSLVPIVGGVALATVKEVAFVPAALICAAVSDLSMAMRNVLSKRSMDALTDVEGKRLGAADMFGLLTVISTAASLPIALAVDGHAIAGVWSAAATASTGGAVGLTSFVTLAGILFYAYNEVAMKALSHVHAVTHAVGNILRRVVIMVASMVAFGTPMSRMSALGSAIAIGGSYMYAMAKHGEKEEEQNAAREMALDEKIDQALPLQLPAKRIQQGQKEAERDL